MDQKFSQIAGVTGSIEDNWGKVILTSRRGIFTGLNS